MAATILVFQLEIATAQEKTVTVSTLDWPPYTGSKLPQGGATSAVVRAAFAESGYKVKVVYRPWKRAIDNALNGADDIVAYFPGYHCKHRDGFISSEPLGNGPLGFAEHVESPLVWSKLDDLGTQQLKIGTVLGYANTDEFDAKVGSGWIRAIPAKNDITNIKKLLRKRVDAIVIDKFVLAYLSATEKSLAPGAKMLRFNDKPLEDKTLYLCFRAEAAPLLQAFNEGLSQVDTDEIVDAYFSTAFK